jgi:hypothetical protein
MLDRQRQYTHHQQPFSHFLMWGAALTSAPAMGRSLVVGCYVACTGEATGTPHGRLLCPARYRRTASPSSFQETGQPTNRTDCCLLAGGAAKEDRFALVCLRPGGLVGGRSVGRRAWQIDRSIEGRLEAVHSGRHGGNRRSLAPLSHGLALDGGGGFCCTPLPARILLRCVRICRGGPASFGAGSRGGDFIAAPTHPSSSVSRPSVTIHPSFPPRLRSRLGCTTGSSLSCLAVPVTAHADSSFRCERRARGKFDRPIDRTPTTDGRYCPPPEGRTSKAPTPSPHLQTEQGGRGPIRGGGGGERG